MPFWEDRKQLAVGALAVSAGVMQGMCMGILAPILPEMEAALATTANEKWLVKMVIGINGLAMVIGAPLGGILVDKMRRTTVLIWAVTLWGCLGLLGFVIDNLWLMVGTRFIVGLVTATAFTVGLTMIGDFDNPSARNYLMGICSAVAATFSILTMSVAGFLGDMHWRMPFALYGVAVPLGIFTIVMGRHIGDQRRAATAAQKTKVPLVIPWGIVFLSFLAGLLTAATSTYTPFLLRDIGVASSAETGFVMSIKAAAIAIVAVFYGTGRKYLSADGALVTSFSIASLGALIVILSGNIIVFTIGFTLIGVGVAWFSPNIMTRAAEAATTETRGRVMGLVKGASSSAPFTSTIAFEPIFRMGGPKAIFITVGLIGAACIVYYLARMAGVRSKATA